MTRYVAFEGIDGCGKDAQADMLASHFASHGYDVAREREPDDTRPLGQAIRQMLATGRGMPALALLFAADRVLAAPRREAALAASGRAIVQIRSFLSTMVYQSERWSRDAMIGMHEGCSVVPEVIVVLLVPPAVARARLASRGRPAEVYETGAWLDTTAAAYAEWARVGELLGSRIVAVDGVGSRDDVHGRVLAALGARRYSA